MVKHVLFVKMKNPSREECEKVKALFLSMKEQIDFIRDLQVGIDYLHSERSYDVVLELIVDDRQALEAYQKNAYHVENAVSCARSSSVGRAEFLMDASVCGPGPGRPEEPCSCGGRYYTMYS